MYRQLHGENSSEEWLPARNGSPSPALRRTRRRLRSTRRRSRPYDGLERRNNRGRSRQVYESDDRTDLISSSPSSFPPSSSSSGNVDDHNPARDPINNRSPISTPQQPPSQPGPSTPWSSSRSSRSAPRPAPSPPEPNPPTSTRRNKGVTISPQEIDDKIVEVLQKPLSKTQLARDQAGRNYVFEAVLATDPRKTVVKIGHTVGTERRRLGRIGASCRHLSIKRASVGAGTRTRTGTGTGTEAGVGGEGDPEEEEEEDDGGAIALFRKVEELAKAELLGAAHPFKCACRTAHREYFDVDRAVAREVARRWGAFCRADPYDAEGNLRPFWDHRLRYRRKISYRSSNSGSNGGSGGGKGSEENEEVEEENRRRRRLHWKRFANPTKLERLWFDVTYTFPKVWRRSWQAVAFVEALAIVLITFPSPFAVGWCVVVMSCTIVGMSGLPLPASLALF